MKPEKLLSCLLLVLAGCSTGPRQPSQDWSVTSPEPPMEVEQVSEGPRVVQAKDVTPPSIIVQTNFSFPNTWVSLERWSRETHAGTLTQLSPAPNRSFALATPNGAMIFYVHSLVARWAGMEFRLGFEPQMVGDELAVHALDLKKNIEPLLERFSVSAKTNPLVVIDPGHGGTNYGARSIFDGNYEKEFTLDWALRIQSQLSAVGWRVLLTRTNDVDLPLSARVAFADEHRADLFISLHFNSVGGNIEQSGLETFCLTPAGMRSTLTRDYEDNPALVYLNNGFDVENLQYAALLHRELLKECGLADRGVRRARF
ncbi:MAG TPA: N-acetylmuramoyl-L-alanine amidase, partial [Candidatus Paceibacterota bacterium]|nr:N-acetylmuramoyl-L-alanine amidase [Candidatus Paceibacterota bacterium]